MIPTIDPAVLQKIITRMAGDEAVHGTLLVDSSGFSIAKYIDWLNAKYGKISVRLFSKLHIMHTLRGMVCAAVVAPGNANDSPYLRPMVEMLPEGDGDVLADAAYGGVENCDAIRDSGRRSVIDSKSNAVINGFNARAEMLRFRKEHPGIFYRILRLRNNVKERLLVHEGAVRRGRARPQGEDPVGGAAVHDRLLQHGLCLRPRHGGGNPRGYGGGCARLPADRHQRRLRWAARANLIAIMPFAAAARRPGRLRWAARAHDPASTPHIPADPDTSAGIREPPVDFFGHGRRDPKT